MEKNITVYTTTQCPFCNMLKGYLSQNDIPYTEVNVEKEPEMMQRIVDQTGQMGFLKQK